MSPVWNNPIICKNHKALFNSQGLFTLRFIQVYLPVAYSLVLFYFLFNYILYSP
ncbi:hypothetical protein BJX66DRAFT_313499 [Aspergillus keveii]|uniref:Uncharacterized protein n=1 Tax=Aspergillus keveii TaxID=714993 RepID=A0ABR4FS67_9EURO